MAKYPTPSEASLFDNCMLLLDVFLVSSGFWWQVHYVVLLSNIIACVRAEAALDRGIITVDVPPFGILKWRVFESTRTWTLVPIESINQCRIQSEGSRKSKQTFGQLSSEKEERMLEYSLNASFKLANRFKTLKWFPENIDVLWLR